MTITASQCKAAQALIGWSRKQLAQSALIAERTLVDFERGARNPLDRTLLDIRRALENAGVVFIDEGSELGPGVRLRKTEKQ